MKKSKVTKILGKRRCGEGEEGAIDIHLHFSGYPTYPWCASSEGHGCYGRTPHKAMSRLLEALARDDRAEAQQ